MRLLNRLIARYGSADGFVINNRRVSIALPMGDLLSSIISFWFFIADGVPVLNGTGIVLVVYNSAGQRTEKLFTTELNRIDMVVDSSFLPAGAYTAWFETRGPMQEYFRTEPFELHILP